MARLAVLVVIAIALLAPRPVHGADASELFADGERAFAGGDYREALRLFEAARAAGATGPSSHYNIGVCQYRLGDYEAAEASFASLAAAFPAMRELAEYNRGLALLADGKRSAAQTAFERARVSTDEKIAALASAQLGELAASPAVAVPRWRGYLSGGLGYDGNVALVDDLSLGRTASSPVMEALGVATRAFRAPLRIDATAYLVRYPDAGEFDQSAVRVALTTEHDVGRWTLAAGPTLSRTTLDGDGFEESLGADLRLRRSIGDRLWFDARVVYDDVDAGDARFAYLEGSRRQVRLAVQQAGLPSVRVGYDLERNERSDPGVSAERERLSLSYERQLPGEWTAGARLAHRKSRYSDAVVPRKERLLELSLGARRDLTIGWTLSAEFRWSDNDSTTAAFEYQSRRLTVGLARSF